jgi:hypothetical protein
MFATKMGTVLAASFAARLPACPLRLHDVEHCWAPSTAFVLPDHRQPRVGTKHVGYIDYAFGENRVDVRSVEPPELTNHDLDDFPAAYQR